MEPRLIPLEPHVAPANLLGYLNFATGRPDARFQRAWDQAFRAVVAAGSERPWLDLPATLLAHLREYHAAGQAAFKDIAQAEAVLNLLVDHVLPAYRRFHADLLGHVPDMELFQSFFLVRVVEAILNQGGPWDEVERITKSALHQLNDYVGFRPIAVLESRDRPDPYDHERFRPIPLFIHGAGTAYGPYEAVIAKALDILQRTPESLLDEAYLDLGLLSEWAYDPRGYDHQHPVNRRPNYVFGEWDPHLLDNHGRYRRYVSRKPILDAVLERLNQHPQFPWEDRLFEAGAVLAGTVLMASCICGRGPGTHDSTVNLAKIVPRIAQLRDAFYDHWLDQMTGPLADRLRIEARTLRQPFGGIRQHLNQRLAAARATQLQERRVALLLATMGYEAEGLKRAERLESPSIRFVTAIQGHIVSADHATDHGDFDAAVAALIQVDDLLHRGIDCGALIDPWNILGFQGQMPLFQSVEDSIHDHRADELLRLMEQTFEAHGRLVCAAAAQGRGDVVAMLAPRSRELAAWWDRFATHEVGGLDSVHGEPIVSAALNAAEVLAEWHARGETPADLAFWRSRRDRLGATQSYALIVRVLLHKRDFAAAIGLLISWLSQADEVDLEEGDHSFYSLSLRWLFTLLARQRLDDRPEVVWPLVRRFFDQLETNADIYFEAPRLDPGTPARSEPGVEKSDDEGAEDTFSAAYEGMTFRDSAEDGTEGSLMEGGGKPDEREFALEAVEDDLSRHLKFLAMVARQWQIVARHAQRYPPDETTRTSLRTWAELAERQQRQLQAFLDELHNYPVAAPSGSYESLVEFDRQRMTKERLLDGAISATMEMVFAVRSLRSAVGGGTADDAPAWQPAMLQLERGILQSDLPVVRAALPRFVEAFREEPLLYSPLDAGGHPRQILRVRLSQMTLRMLLEGLPRLGLIRESYGVLRLARDMEQRNSGRGRQVTDYNRLFQNAFQAVITVVVESARHWQPAYDPRQLVRTLEALGNPFFVLWYEHSQTVRLSTLEGISNQEQWDDFIRFLRDVSPDLFTAKFMTLGNLRAILNRGLGQFLDYLQSDAEEDERPRRLLAALERGYDRGKAIHHLETALKAIVENYDEYKDYNATTTQSDYGDNLFRLLSFLRLKSSYDRHAWNFRPLVWLHEVLVRKGMTEVAALWRQKFVRLTQERAELHVQELKELQREHAMSLRTIADTIEERFVKPLDVDSLVARIEPAMKATRTRQGQAEALANLLAALKPFEAQPTGVGLDVPGWLRALESEIHRLQEEEAALAGVPESTFEFPSVRLSLADLEWQLREWERPFLPE